jgi:hypothetical protein
MNNPDLAKFLDRALSLPPEEVISKLDALLKTSPFHKHLEHVVIHKERNGLVF